MTDYAEIIAQLRDHIGYPIPSMRFVAANALEAQARRIAELMAAKVFWEKKVSEMTLALHEKDASIAELKAALKPFDEMLQRDFSIMADDKRYADYFTSTVLMRLGYLRAARAAYRGEKEC